MTSGRSRHFFGVIVSTLMVAVLFAVLVLAVRAGHGLGYQPAAARSTTGASVSLSALPDSMVCHGAGGGPHPEWVSFCPSTTIKVPANSLVTVTILQYDSATALHNPFFDQVRGTVGGTMTVNGRAMTQLSSDTAGHTFTIQTPPNEHEDPLFVSVPLLGVPENAPNVVTINGNPYPRPNVIVFRFRTGGPGSYVWHCYVPCGTGLAGDGIGGQNNFGGPMSTTGYMSGTLTVS
ncbi:MAG TPA: hypothetical protein VLP43_03885 [Solirubrobacteraceae bacterium]|nr:hypothetical protein [Solirubrobacteraceae bacterium]